MTFRFSLVLLLVLGITDAWLLAHPNLLGRLGIWFYQYEYLKNFPRALLTVSLVLSSTLGMVTLLKRLFSPRLAVLTLTGLLVLVLIILLSTYLKFSAGTYRYTSQSFIWGAYLLPTLMALIIAQGIYSIFRSGKLQ